MDVLHKLLLETRGLRDQIFSFSKCFPPFPLPCQQQKYFRQTTCRICQCVLHMLRKWQIGKTMFLPLQQIVHNWWHEQWGAKGLRRGCGSNCCFLLPFPIATDRQHISRSNNRYQARGRKGFLVRCQLHGVKFLCLCVCVENSVYAKVFVILAALG